MATTRELAIGECEAAAMALHEACVIPGMSADSRLDLRARLAAMVLGNIDLANDITMLVIEGGSGLYVSQVDGLCDEDDDSLFN